MPNTNNSNSLIETQPNHLWGVKIWDATGIYYYTEVNVSQSVQHNRPTGSQVGYNSLYPFHTHNGIASYWSGSCSGNFSDNKSGDCYEDYNFDYRQNLDGSYTYNTKYLAGFIKWLHNDLTKQLQLSESLVIPVGILGEIQWDTEHTIDDGEDVTISFDWEQVGDEYSLLEDGTVYVDTCPNCGVVLAPSAVYCQKCGLLISSNGGVSG